MSERRWRSAANRPSRQARRGWASLCREPSLKNRTASPRATKIQQPKNSPLAPTSSPAPPPPKNPSPCSPRIKRKPPPGFFGPNPGQFGSESGHFGSILGFPGEKSHRFGPHFPLPEAPSAPGDVQKLHLPTHAHKRTPFTPLPQSHTNYRMFITFTSKNIPLSL